MSTYYIDLGDGERIDLSESQVDLMNYDNNTGYNIYSLAICDEKGQVDRQFDFADPVARDAFAEENGLDMVNYEWLFDVENFITRVDGRREESIPCYCDYQIAYC